MAGRFDERGLNMKMASMAVLVLVAAVVGPNYGDATITCEQVTTWLTPCIPYGMLGSMVFGGTVPPGCCEGIKALNAAANTTEDHRAQCKCVKEGAANIPGLNYDYVNELPDKCHSTCPYKLTYDLDCSKVN